MQFQVPQFIEIEDKIFGPLSFRQFMYLAGAVGISVFLYTYLPFFLAVLFIIPVCAFALALAFYKYNNRPFVMTLEAAFKYALKSNLYIWKRVEKAAEAKAEESIAAAVSAPRISDSKLRDISWGLDVHKNVR